MLSKLWNTVFTGLRCKKNPQNHAAHWAMRMNSIRPANFPPTGTCYLIGRDESRIFYGSDVSDPYIRHLVGKFRGKVSRRDFAYAKCRGVRIAAP